MSWRICIKKVISNLEGPKRASRHLENKPIPPFFIVYLPGPRHFTSFACTLSRIFFCMPRMLQRHNDEIILLKIGSANQRIYNPLFAASDMCSMTKQRQGERRRKRRKLRGLFPFCWILRYRLFNWVTYTSILHSLTYVYRMVQRHWLLRVSFVRYMIEPRYVTVYKQLAIVFLD